MPAVRHTGPMASKGPLLTTALQTLAIKHPHLQREKGHASFSECSKQYSESASGCASSSQGLCIIDLNTTQKGTQERKRKQGQ